MLKTVLNQCWD